VVYIEIVNDHCARSYDMTWFVLVIEKGGPDAKRIQIYYFAAASIVWTNNLKLQASRGRLGCSIDPESSPDVRM